MAHFALINKYKEVIHVSVVNNDKLLDEHNQEQEQLGIDHLNRVHAKSKWPKADGSFYDNRELTWKQTSYNAKSGDGFRKNFAGKGYTWSEDLGGFVAPKPSEPQSEMISEAGSFVLNEEKCIYEFTGKLKAPEIKK